MSALLNIHLSVLLASSSKKNSNEHPFAEPRSECLFDTFNSVHEDNHTEDAQNSQNNCTENGYLIRDSPVCMVCGSNERVVNSDLVAQIVLLSLEKNKKKKSIPIDVYTVARNNRYVPLCQSCSQTCRERTLSLTHVGDVKNWREFPILEYLEKNLVISKQRMLEIMGDGFDSKHFGCRLKRLCSRLTNINSKNVELEAAVERARTAVKNRQRVLRRARCSLKKSAVCLEEEVQKQKQKGNFRK